MSEPHDDDDEMTIPEIIVELAREYTSFLLALYAMLALMFAPVDGLLWLTLPLYGLFHYRWVDVPPKVLLICTQETEKQADHFAQQLNDEFDLVIKITPSTSKVSDEGE